MLSLCQACEDISMELMTLEESSWRVPKQVPDPQSHSLTDPSRLLAVIEKIGYIQFPWDVMICRLMSILLNTNVCVWKAFYYCRWKNWKWNIQLFWEQSIFKTKKEWKQVKYSIPLNMLQWIKKGMNDIIISNDFIMRMSPFIRFQTPK